MSGADKPINVIEALNLALTDALEADPRVLVLGEDIGDVENGGIVGVTRGLSTRFGELRVRTTPISEQAIVGAAIGAAINGFRPVAEIMLMNFVAVAMDMICNHAAKLRFVRRADPGADQIRTMTGAGWDRRPAQRLSKRGSRIRLASKVVAPATPADAYGLLLRASMIPTRASSSRTCRSTGARVRRPRAVSGFRSARPG